MHRKIQFTRLRREFLIILSATASSFSNAYGQDEDQLIPPDQTVIVDRSDYTFEEIASFDRLAAAWRKQDSEQLTDVALKFLEGERVLLRSHKKIKAIDVVDIAIRVATERNDKASLDRLAKAMMREGDKERSELVNLTIATAGAARASDPVLKEGSPEVVAEIESFVLAIESARIAGSVSQFTALQSELSELSVSDAQRMALGKLIEESQDSTDVDDTTLEVMKELDQVSGIIRSSEEIKGPEGMAFLLPDYSGQESPELLTQAFEESAKSWRTPDEAPKLAFAEEDTLPQLQGASRGGYWTDWWGPGEQRPEWYAYGANGRQSIYQYTNNPGVWENNNCGQAAAATMLTFHRVQAKYPQRDNGTTEFGDIIDNTFPPKFADFGPLKINFSTPELVIQICNNYGLDCWKQGGSAFPELPADASKRLNADLKSLEYWVSWGYPCIVVTDVRKLGWKEKDGKPSKGWHYQVVYAYDKSNVWLTNNGGNPKVSKSTFRNAWVRLVGLGYILTQPKPGMQTFPAP